MPRHEIKTVRFINSVAIIRNQSGGVRAIILHNRYVSCLHEGEGKPILFLHGYMSQKESFYYQIKFFAEHGFMCVAPDFPGFGASAPLSGAWSVGDYASWLSSFAAAQNLCCPHIIAHSFGARVALKLLSAENMADRLVITGGAGLVKPRSSAYMRKVRAYRLVKKIAPSFAERHFGSAEYRSLPPIMKESYKKIVNEDLSACARLIKNKTLLVYGRDDAVTPPQEEGAIFNRLIYGSELKVIDGDHFCFCRNAATFNAAVLAFLNGG